MGWCGATDIMDTALKAVEAAVDRVLEMGAGAQADVRRCMDEALRPFVSTIAEKLRDGDWDCIDESEYFDRFQQEMHGFTDREYEVWLIDRLKWAGDDAERRDVVDRLTALHEKMARSVNGTG